MTDGMGRDEGQWGRRGCLTLTSSSHRVGRRGGVGWVGCNGVVSREKGVCGVVSFT
jgi:hypothetical protein